MRRTGTLIAAGNIKALEGTKVPDALGAFIDVCSNRQTHFIGQIGVQCRAQRQV